MSAVAPKDLDKTCFIHPKDVLVSMRLIGKPEAAISAEEVPGPGGNTIRFISAPEGTKRIQVNFIFD